MCNCDVLPPPHDLIACRGHLYAIAHAAVLSSISEGAPWRTRNAERWSQRFWDLSERMRDGVLASRPDDFDVPVDELGRIRLRLSRRAEGGSGADA